MGHPSITSPKTHVISGRTLCKAQSAPTPMLTTYMACINKLVKKSLKLSVLLKEEVEGRLAVIVTKLYTTFHKCSEKLVKV